MVCSRLSVCDGGYGPGGTAKLECAAFDVKLTNARRRGCGRSSVSNGKNAKRGRTERRSVDAYIAIVLNFQSRRVVRCVGREELKPASGETACILKAGGSVGGYALNINVKIDASICRARSEEVCACASNVKASRR
jgi:hypothetical protein